ncbi:MAG: Fpg/Nei family DNA glycosylase [Gemmatimonadetes bacterium]|nr:Fpg/Nei family DNA glycosylase [Gemmatimonadota bacterium]
MPELPDILTYLDALRPRIAGARLKAIRVSGPFVVRSVDPPLAEAIGQTLTSIDRLGKRIVMGLTDDLFIVIHLMIAGRFKWLEAKAKVPRKYGLAAFDFSTGTLLLTEAGVRRRASIHLVRGKAGLAEHDRGGLEVLDATPAEFRAALTAQNHTLKRALTDPRILSGIGNSYSDEILHAARLSPLQQVKNLDDGEFERLYGATQSVLRRWIDEFRHESDGGKTFPTRVTAFREGMAVHGRHRQPCPVCGSPVQRIAYAENEVNYCATCQTGGKLLADRAWSRLLKSDWPKTLDELELKLEERRG